MALPKIDTPVYDLELPLSKKKIRFRPFLVKEQRNLMMAMESDDKETIERNIRQVLHNCTLTEGLEIDRLPIIDVEFYFINLRARSVGEVVQNRYRCENAVEEKVCGNLMDVELNILEIQPDMSGVVNDVIQINDRISVKLKFPEFSILERANKFESVTDMAFDMIAESVEYIFDGEQYYYAAESEPDEIIEFIESLNQDQFNKIENFFNNLPKLNKNIEVDCKKCGFHHSIQVEGLDSFFA
jgi:hypothetical protein